MYIHTMCMYGFDLGLSQFRAEKNNRHLSCEINGQRKSNKIVKYDQG